MPFSKNTVGWLNFLTINFCALVTGIAIMDVVTEKPINAFQLLFAWIVALMITFTRGLMGFNKQV